MNSTLQKREQLRAKIENARGNMSPVEPPPLTYSFTDRPAKPVESTIALARRLGVDLPHDAIDLFPTKIGPRIIHFPSTNRILKIGPNVSQAEANAMELLSSKTSVPVPQVFASAEAGDIGFLLMSTIRGRPLREVWPLSTDRRAQILGQLRGYIKEWRTLQADYLGGVGGYACKDVFFLHICVHSECKTTYGPYTTRSEYTSGLWKALINSRPNRRLLPSDQAVFEPFEALKDETKVFTHGDLHPGNIMIDDNFNVCGIIDWGQSGFSISDREYFESRSRSRDPQWGMFLDDLFGQDTTSEIFMSLSKLNSELVRFSGV